MRSRLFRVPVEVTFEVLVPMTGDVDADRQAAEDAIRAIHDRIVGCAPYETSIITGKLPALQVKYIDYGYPEET